jgi:hypothetical protein
MFSTLAFIPVPDGMTSAGIIAFIVIAAISAWYVNKRRGDREFNDKVNDEIARRAAQAEARDK